MPGLSISKLAVAFALVATVVAFGARPVQAVPAVAPPTIVQMQGAGTPWRVNVAGLWLRSAPGVSSKALALLKGGTVVNARETSADGRWLNVTHGDLEGWVFARYVVPNRVATVTTPLPNATIASGARVAGTFTIAPFENNLNWRVFDRAGLVIGQGFTTVSSTDVGGPGSFDFAVTYRSRVDQMGRLALYEVSPKDGSYLTWKIVPLQLSRTG